MKIGKFIAAILWSIILVMITSCARSNSEKKYKSGGNLTTDDQHGRNLKLEKENKKIVTDFFNTFYNEKDLAKAKNHDAY